MTQFVFHGQIRGRDFHSAGGNMEVTHVEIQGSEITPHMALAEVHRLRQQLRRLRLAPDVLAETKRELTSVQEQLGTAEADKRTVARSLERFTEILKDVGALAAASNSLSGPLQTLASWLGAAGKPILGLLGMP